MTKQVQRRRGTATQHTSFTGAEGELSVNTTNKSVHVHDGATAGGIELARKDGSNVAFTSGTLDGVTIGGTTAGAGTFTNLTATGTTTLAGASTSADITFGDNDKAIFGAGSDLQIYHDGANSRIQDTATGSLILAGTNFYVNNTGDTKSYLAGLDGGTTPYVRLYYDGATRLDTTATGVDITGTLTSDGLTVDGDAVFTTGDTIRLNTADGSDNGVLAVAGGGGNSDARGAKVRFYGNEHSSLGGVLDLAAGNVSGGHIYNFTGAKLRQKIDYNGDISFYEDTGTTPKFFWDASAESLGIGTTSLSTNSIIKEVHINSPYTNGVSRLRLSSSVENMEAAVGLTGYLGDDALYFAIGSSGDGSATERMRIDSSGNVGIGTSSPSSFAANASNLVVGSGSGTEGITVYSGSSNYGVIYFADGTSGASAYAGNINYNHADNSMRLGTNGSTTDVVIDSSGNLLVGRTTSALGGGNGGLLQIGSGIGGSGMTIHSSTTGIGDIQFADGTTGADSYRGLVRYDHSNNSMQFRINASERMRIDSSGNLLHNKTSSDATSVGTELRAGGSGVVSLVVTSSGTNAAYFNRLSSNGTVVNFAKDDTTVGSIQSVSGVVSNIILDPRSAVKGSGLRGASSDASEGLLLPIDNAGNLADGTITLGQPSSRFKDLYLSGGVYLGGTGSANHLDDYEEGTWTPTLSASTTAPTVSSYDTRVGQYTKVGDTVTFIAVIRATLSAAGSGSPRVTGLPFASTTSLPAAYLGLRNILSGTPSPYISSTHVQIDGTSYVTSSNLYLCFSGTYKA